LSAVKGGGGPLMCTVFTRTSNQSVAGGGGTMGKGHVKKVTRGGRPKLSDRT